MRRLLFNLVATASLLLCGALVVFWVRSFWATDAIEFQQGGEQWELASEFGRLRVGNTPQLHLHLVALSNLDKQVRLRPTDPAQYIAERRRLLRRIQILVPGPSGMPQPQLQVRQYELPHWAAIAAAAILPAAWVVRWTRKRRRVARGLCVECGYDLRASPNRCPECGAIPLIPPNAAVPCASTS
jgi:hypothetical protein